MTKNPVVVETPPRLRSLLFAPASRPDMCAKLPRSGPDGVVLDQVVTAFGDDERFLTDAAIGRSIGYSGKLYIHPAQVPLANQCFSRVGPEPS